MIAVIGTGAIGCYFAGILIESGHAVVLVARDSPSSKAREAALRKHGLTMSVQRLTGPRTSRLIAPEAMARAFARPDALATCDTILVTVKRPGNRWVAEVLQKHAKRGATVVCLQNGLGQRAELLASAEWGAAGPPQIVESVLVIAANLEEPADSTPASVYYPGKQDLLAVEASGGLAAAAGATAALVTKAGFPAKAVPEFGSAQRSKLALNMNNAVCALMGLSVAEAVGDATSRRLLRACLAEASAVYAAEGYVLDPKLGAFLRVLSAPACVFACLKRVLPLPAKGFHSSMNKDLLAADGRETEVAYLNGEVAATGKRVGLPTPFASRIVDIIKEMHTGARERRALTPSEVERIFFSSSR